MGFYLVLKKKIQVLHGISNQLRTIQKDFKIPLGHTVSFMFASEPMQFFLLHLKSDEFW